MENAKGAWRSGSAAPAVLDHGGLQWNSEIVSPPVEAVPDVPRKRFEALEAFRGLAALGITIFHLGCCFSTIDFPVNLVSLHLLVDFFMVLGGFVFCHSFVFSEKANDPLKEIGHRVARLWPVNFLMMVVGYCFGNVVGDWSFNAGPFLYQCLLLNYYVVNVSPNPPAWTMSCEFWVNVACALLVSKETPTWLLILLSTFCHSLLFFNTGSLATYSELYFMDQWYGWKMMFRIVANLLLSSGLLRVAASFLLGIVSYRLYLLMPELPDSGSSRLAAGVAEAVLLAAMLCMLFCQPAGRLDFLAPWLWVLVMAGFACEYSWISWALSFAAPLGAYAYSTYMIHWVLLTVLARHDLLQSDEKFKLSPLMYFWGSLLPCAVLTYHALEMPCNRLLRRSWDAILEKVRPPTPDQYHVGQGYMTTDSTKLWHRQPMDIGSLQDAKYWFRRPADDGCAETSCRQVMVPDPRDRPFQQWENYDEAAGSRRSRAWYGICAGPCSPRGMCSNREARPAQ